MENGKILNSIIKMSSLIEQQVMLLISDKCKLNRVISTINEGIKISVCIMTYNEERVIKRCIESVIDFADEIIVMDTGSTDHTIEIIEMCYPNIKIYTESMDNGFAYIRNRMNSIARNQWIFQLDADEYLGDNAKEVITMYIAVLENIAVFPKILSPIITNHDGTVIDNTKRIYKKNVNLMYYGRAHEELRYNNNPRTEYCIIDIEYYHDGYRKEIIEEKKKYQRNIIQLEKMIDEEKNPRWYYFLARERLCVEEEKSKIMPLLEEGIEIANNMNSEYLIGLLDIYLQMPIETWKFRILGEILNKITTIFPKCIETHYYLLFLEIVKSQKNLLEIGKQEVVKITEMDEVYSIWEKCEDDIFWLLGYLYFITNRFDLALIMWKKVSSVQNIKKIEDFGFEIKKFINTLEKEIINEEKRCDK